MSLVIIQILVPIQQVQILALLELHRSEIECYIEEVKLFRPEAESDFVRALLLRPKSQEEWHTYCSQHKKIISERFKEILLDTGLAAVLFEINFEF